MRHTIKTTLAAALIGAMPLGLQAQDNMGGSGSGAGSDSDMNQSQQMDQGDQMGQDQGQGQQMQGQGQDMGQGMNQGMGQSQADMPFDTDMQRVSYAIGVQLGSNFKRQGIQLDSAKLAQGIKDAMSGSDMAMNPQQLQQVLMAFQQKMQAQQMQKRQQMGQKNSSQGEQFLKQNQQKEGVKVTDSGLQYKVEKEGSGQAPKDGDTVVVNYKGTFPDGKVFDSSYQRGQPATFKVGQVIEGWNEALKMMKPGAKYHLVIPADLAYGDRGSQAIGPNQVLVFDVELVKVQKDDGQGDDMQMQQDSQGSGSDDQM